MAKVLSQTPRAVFKRAQRREVKTRGLLFLKAAGRVDFSSRKLTAIILEIERVSGYKFPPIANRLQHLLDFLANGIGPVAVKPPAVLKLPKLTKADRQAFYDSDAWRAVRYQALKANDGRCELCGASKHDGIALHVDHIKPRSIYPHLELVATNLQILCEPCNMGKSNRDETDWRAGIGN